MNRLSVSCRVGGAAVAMLALAGASCAARQPRSLADRFVHEDTETAGTEDLLDLFPRADTDAGDAAGEVVSPPSAVDRVDWIVGETRPKLVQGETVESANEALSTALDAYAANPAPGNALALAAVYQDLGVFDAAHKHLSQALETEPRNARLLEARARVWRDWGVPGLGLGDAARAVFFAPDWAVAHNTRGTLLFLLGQSDASLESFEAARQLAPGEAYILSNLCYVEADLGHLEAARKHCDAALALDPALETALANRKALGGGGE